MIWSIFGEGSTGLFLVMSVYPHIDSEAPKVQLLENLPSRVSLGYQMVI